MKTIALLALLALCACSDHQQRHRHDGYDGRRRQVNTSHHDQQSHEDADDGWWNGKKHRND